MKTLKNVIKDIRQVQALLKEEQWVSIDYIPNYLVSNLGRIKDIRTDEVLCITSGRTVTLNKKNYIVARLVAEAFIGESLYAYVVHHRNKDSQDNYSGKGEWW